MDLGYHLLSGCEKLAGDEYLKSHDNALMVFATEWAKILELLDKNVKWYEQSWERGKVLENEKAKLLWDFEFRTRKKTRARRPDLILEDKEVKQIFIVDMSCPMEGNVDAKRSAKLKKYRQLAFETRERRKNYTVEILPLIVGSLGGGGNKNWEMIQKVCGKDRKDILAEMTKVALWEGESMIRKIDEQ